MTIEIKQVDLEMGRAFEKEWSGLPFRQPLAELLATQRSTYEALIAELERQILIQKNAARTIMHCEGDELRRLREQAREHHVAIQTLDSERAANARLTNELAAAEARLAEAVRWVKAVINIPAVRQILGSNHTPGCDCPLCGAARFIQETERG